MPLQCIQQEASSLLHPVQIQVVTPEAALAGDNNNPPIATTARSDITLTLVPSSGSAAPLQSAEADASMNGNPSSHPVGAPLVHDEHLYYGRPNGNNYERSQSDDSNSQRIQRIHICLLVEQIMYTIFYTF